MREVNIISFSSNIGHVSYDQWFDWPVDLVNIQVAEHVFCEVCLKLSILIIKSKQNVETNEVLF